MRKSRFTEEQIVAALKEHAAGAGTGELCRRLGISNETLYNWKRKYGGLSVSETRRLKALEEENRRLKKLLADQMLDNEAKDEPSDGANVLADLGAVPDPSHGYRIACTMDRTGSHPAFTITITDLTTGIDVVTNKQVTDAARPATFGGSQIGWRVRQKNDTVGFTLDNLRLLPA